MVATSPVKICSLLSCFSHKSLGRSLVLDTVKSILTPRPCYFANMPVEILIHILSHAVDGRNKTLFAVCGVCRQWREILFDVPHVWRSLILTGYSYWTPDKVEAWLRRSKGSLSRLYLGGQCKVLTEDSLYKRIPWSTLRELCIIDWEWFWDKKYFLEEIADQLQVESLVLSSGYPNFQYFLGMMETERLQSLVCRVRHGVLPLDNIASSSLTKVELTGNFASSELLVLLDRNPMIERMVIADARTAVGEDPVVGAGSIELVHLTHLELRDYYFSSRFLGLILFPSVRTLILSGIGGTCIPVIATRQVPHLEEFQLSNTFYDHRYLIPLLRNALALKTLFIRSCHELEGKADLGIQALAEVIPQGSVTTPDAVGALCCPQLQKVDLSQLRGLSASALLRLVRTRLNGTSKSKILRLCLDDKPPIYGTRFSLSEQDAEWLRTNVPDFRYVRG